MRRASVFLCLAVLLVQPAPGEETEAPRDKPALDIRVVTDEADAVLALLAKRNRGEALSDTDWESVRATEGYRRLKQRDESYGVEAFDDRFREWLMGVDRSGVDRFRDGVERWRTLDATEAGRVALAYLPESTHLRATIYPVLKPASNSFVFEVDTDPAIFMYVSGEDTESELANTLAHELHHIGTSAGCTEPVREPPTEEAGAVLRWMGAFAEGLAMLAAAGGPSVHPHAGRPAEEWIVWERDLAQFDRDRERIESFFLDILSGSLDTEAQVPRFFELINTEDVPQGAFYTVGWKMGALVEQRFGRQTVIGAICDMPRLLMAYNQIAREYPRGDQGALPTWSPTLLRAIGATDLMGTWKTPLEHNGQHDELVLRFEINESGGVNAVLSLPPLDAWDVATVPARLDGSRIDLGPLVLEQEPDGSLSGELSGTMIPVHTIPLAFRRSDPITPLAAPPIEAPVAEPVWTVDLGSPVWAGLATGLGRLYVGADDGLLRALDAKTGEVEWQFQTGGAIRARATVTDDRIFVHSDDGFLYALNPESGKEIWRASVASKPVERPALGTEGNRYNHYASSAVLVGDTVFVGGFDGRLYALDAVSGDERWQHAVGDTIAGTPAVAGDRVVFGSFDNHVYALDRGSGDELWRYDTGAAVVSIPLVFDGRVLIGSRSFDLLALDAETGQMGWKYYFFYSWVESSAVERDGIAYIGSSDGQLVVALDARDGKEQWRFDTGGSPWSQPAVTDSTVFIGTVGVADYMVAHEADLFAIDRRTGEPRWHFPLQRPGSEAHWGFGAATAVDATMVFAAGLDGRVRAFPQSP